MIFSAAAPPVTQFLQSLLLGVLLSVLYDLFYAVRCLFPVRMQAHIVLDLLYFVLFGVLLFNFLLTETAGRLRYFIILGVIIGWGLYHATMSRLTVRFFNGVIGGVRAVLRAVFRPVIALARWISLRLRDLCKKGTAKCKSAKNRLKKHHRMRYNKVSNRCREENGREKHMTIKQTNRILAFVIVFLVLLIAVYFVKGRVRAAQMEAELAAAQQRVNDQQAENDEIGRMLENSDYYLNQEARGEGNYCDPEEKVYVVVP